MEASRRNASALSVRFSTSFARRRQRFSQAIVRSTNPAHWQDLARAPAGRGLRGAPVSRGALYLMLKNQIYRGEIVHKGKALPGEHAAIVDEDLWRRVQSHLEENRIERRGGDKALEPSLLAGIVFDAGSEPMTPTHAVKKGTRYRYYISRRLITGPASDSSRGQRIPASNLEALVISRVRKRRKIGCDKRPCFLLCCLKVFQVFASFCCGKTPPDRTPPFGRRSRSPFSSWRRPTRRRWSRRSPRRSKRASKSALGPVGKVVILEGNPEADNAVQRKNGFMDSVAEGKLQLSETTRSTGGSAGRRRTTDPDVRNSRIRFFTREIRSRRRSRAITTLVHARASSARPRLPAAWGA